MTTKSILYKKKQPGYGTLYSLFQKKILDENFAKTSCEPIRPQKFHQFYLLINRVEISFSRKV